MLFLLQCPRLPLNIHHWTLHGKFWWLAYTQTPSHSTSRATKNKQTAAYKGLSWHIKTHSPPVVPLIFCFTIQSPPPWPTSHPSSNFPFFSGLAKLRLCPLFFICLFVLCDEEGGFGYSYGCWGGRASDGKGGCEAVCIQFSKEWSESQRCCCEEVGPRWISFIAAESSPCLPFSVILYLHTCIVLTYCTVMSAICCYITINMSLEVTLQLWRVWQKPFS